MTAARRLDWAEVAAVLALVLALVWRVWSPLPEGSAVRAGVEYGVALALAALVVRSFARRWAGLGSLGLAAPGAGWRSVAGFTAAAAAVLASLGALLDTAELSQERVVWLSSYVPGLIGQQLLLQSYLNDRLFELAPSSEPRGRLRFAVGLATLAFVAMHAPNPMLMAVVAPACLFWTRHFRRHRNLLAPIASHLALGFAAMVCLGPGPMLDLRVGPGALELLARRW